MISSSGGFYRSLSFTWTIKFVLVSTVEVCICMYMLDPSVVQQRGEDARYVFHYAVSDLSLIHI